MVLSKVSTLISAVNTAVIASAISHPEILGVPLSYPAAAPVLELVQPKPLQMCPNWAPLRCLSKEKGPKLSYLNIVAYVQPTWRPCWFGAWHLASSRPSIPHPLSRNPADLAWCPLLLALPLTPKASLSAPPHLPEALPLQASATERLPDVQYV